jgi:hypothetical protein
LAIAIAKQQKSTDKTKNGVLGINGKNDRMKK